MAAPLWVEVDEVDVVLDLAAGSAHDASENLRHRDDGGAHVEGEALLGEDVHLAAEVLVALDERDGDAMRVDFWYIDKNAAGFLLIAPSVYPNDQLPTLADYPWHLIDEERFARENAALREENLFVSLSFYDTDDAPPLEICLLVGRMGGDKLILLVTKTDYPKTAPKVRVAPFIHSKPDDDMYKVFEQAWKTSDAVDMGFDWTPDHTLLDVVKAVEAKVKK